MARKTKMRRTRYTDADRRFAKKWKIPLWEAHKVRKTMRGKKRLKNWEDGERMVHLKSFSPSYRKKVSRKRKVRRTLRKIYDGIHF